MTDWRILLLGGTTATGKSTSAQIVARKQGIGCMSGDSVWRAILAMTTPETMPMLHRWPRASDDPGPPEPLAGLHIEEADLLTPALDAFLDNETREGNTFVFHCAWITPAMAARRCAASKVVRAVFIDESSEAAIIASILARSGRTEPTHRQKVMARTAVLYGKWLRDGARRLGLPLVGALPRETLADRIIESANGEGRAIA